MDVSLTKSAWASDGASSAALEENNGSHPYREIETVLSAQQECMYT